MKVMIKNNLMSVSGDSTVKDEAGNKVFRVDGKLFSITKKKDIRDMSGKRLYRVRNKFFHAFVHSAIIYDQNKRKIAKVKDKAFNFKKEFFVVGYKDEIKFQGAFLSPRCEILRNGDVIGTMTRRIDWTDAFELDADEADMPFLVAIVIAIDNITDRKYKDSK